MVKKTGNVFVKSVLKNVKWLLGATFRKKIKKGASRNDLLLFAITIKYCYAFSEFCSVFILLYAGQSWVDLQDVKPNATKNTTVATMINAFFITNRLQYN